VSETGDDQNSGSEEQPFQTFQRADAALQPGDTVIVQDGHYDVGAGGFVTTRSGTKEQPITWQAEHVGQVFVTNRREVTGFESAEGQAFRARLAEEPLFLLADEDMLFPLREGEDAVGPQWQPGTWRYAEGTLTVWLWDSAPPDGHKIWASYGNLINLTGDASYQIWDGFVFEYGLCGWKTHYPECRFNTVRNCTFRYVGQGILGVWDALIEHCHFERIGCTHWEHGIYCGGENTLIRYCTFRDIAGGALHLYPEPRNITAYGNVIGPSRVPHHIWGGTTGIYAWGQGEHRIFRNVIYGGHNVGISLNSDHCLIANNTILEVTGTALYVYDRVGHTLQNNVLEAQDSYVYVGRPDNVLDYNFYLGKGQWMWMEQPLPDFAAYRQASGQDAHSRYGLEAGFINPDRQDFRPSPDSPLIDAGVAIPGVTDGFRGNAPDLGAFEAGRERLGKPGPVER
jgi:parallel beta-helix repeat protein